MRVARVAAERRALRRSLERVDELDEIADTLPVDDARADRLRRIARHELDELQPVRPVIAAELLDVSERTVRTWADKGILAVRRIKPRMLLDATSVVRVARLVAALRKAGQDRNLATALYQRLVDDQLLQDPDLASSLEQMRRGEGRLRQPKGAVL